MSFNDNADLLAKNWFPYEKNLINLVKKYPVTYFPSQSKRPTKFNKAAWIEIGTQLCQPSKTCKQLWTKIKYRYAKIMNLINTGKIAKEAAMSHPITAKYFYGLLNFLDPFLSEITDVKIPFSIHRSINDLFGLKTKRTQYVSRKGLDTQLVTHAQVKALLRERLPNDKYNWDIMDTQYLQLVVGNAIKQKLEELLLKKDDLSNNDRNDTINTINTPMMPSKHLRVVRKRKPSLTLIPSKNIQNNDEENTTETVSLGLETELIIEDDMKREAENDNIKMEDEDDIIEENLTLDMNINNTTDENYDLEQILPSTQIILPAVHDTMKNTISSLNNDLINIEHKMDDNTMTDNCEPQLCPISDEYIRNFLNELGEVMSMELSISKQKILKSQINELLKDMLL